MRALVLGSLMGLVTASLVATLRGSGRRPSSAHRARRSAGQLRSRDKLAAAVAGLAVVAVVLPPAALGLMVAWWTRRRVRAHRAEQEHRRRVRHALPDLVDLLILAGSAGMSLPVAHPRVAVHTPAPVGPALVAAHEAALLGRPRADALLAELAPLGDRAHALAHVLVDHLRYGVPLLPGLERTGLELRLDRRRRAELEARRVPVRLLAPLVTCVLPAFALLTVVPLLAASLEALPT